MKIKSQMQWGDKTYDLYYYDTDSFDGLPKGQCRQIYAVAFYQDKLIITFNGKRKFWSLIGGTIETKETVEQALVREVQEESNMKILKHAPIGYQEVVDPDGQTIYQLRSCCLVEPFGPFMADPAGDITEIKLIDPKDYKKYFDWGKIGDQIIQRGIEIKNKLP